MSKKPIADCFFIRCLFLAFLLNIFVVLHSVGAAPPTASGQTDDEVLFGGGGGIANVGGDQQGVVDEGENPKPGDGGGGGKEIVFCYSDEDCGDGARCDGDYVGSCNCDDCVLNGTIPMTPPAFDAERGDENDDSPDDEADPLGLHHKRRLATTTPGGFGACDRLHCGRCGDFQQLKKDAAQKSSSSSSSSSSSVEEKEEEKMVAPLTEFCSRERCTAPEANGPSPDCFGLPCRAGICMAAKKKGNKKNGRGGGQKSNGNEE